jgi:hypothetical protein
MSIYGQTAFASATFSPARTEKRALKSLPDSTPKLKVVLKVVSALAGG